MGFETLNRGLRGQASIAAPFRINAMTGAQ